MTANIHQFVTPRNRRHASFGNTTNQTLAMILGMITILMCAALGFFYLHQVLGNASQGSDIHALEANIEKLKEQQRQLELEGASLRSIHTLEERIDKLNLVTTDTVAYLVPTTTDHVALVK